ncbi:MAG: hypothetical protein IKH22_04100 [Prevotella sp.]|nr:hypothetical protein [Prevotella sp.]
MSPYKPIAFPPSILHLSSITLHQSPITLHPSPITHHPSPITHAPTSRPQLCRRPPALQT